MTALERTILECARAMTSATPDQIEDTTLSLGAEHPDLESILDGLRLAHRVITRNNAGGTILHVSWPTGASATFESEGNRTLAEMASITGNGTDRHADTFMMSLAGDYSFNAVIDTRMAWESFFDALHGATDIPMPALFEYVQSAAVFANQFGSKGIEK